MAIDREKYIDEIVDAAQYFARDSKEAQFLIELAKSLESISDSEFKKWVVVNGDNIFKFLPDDATLYKAAATAKEPDSWVNDKPDVTKIFNDDQIALHPEIIPEPRLKGLAEANGFTEDQLKDELEKQALIQRRKDNMWPEWAWPEGVPGRGVANWLLNGVQQVFTPRLYEKRLREGIDTDVVNRETLLDIMENGLYMANPAGRIGQLGRVANAASKAGKLGEKALKAGEFVLGAGVNPLVMEGADAVAFDDPENDRSEFSWGDVLNGFGTNIGAPLTLKLGAAGIGKMAGGFGPAEKVNKWIWNLGKGDLKSELAAVQKNNDRYLKMKETIQKRGRSQYDAEELKWFDDWAKGFENTNFTSEEFEQILLSNGKNLDEKFKNWYKKKYGESETQTLRAIRNADGEEFAEELMESVKKDRSDDVAKWFKESNYGHLNDKGLKSSERIAAEQMAMDYFTNKYGDVEYDTDRNASLPIVGKIAKAVHEYEKEKAEEEARKESVRRYKINFMLGGE